MPFKQDRYITGVKVGRLTILCKGLPVKTEKRNRSTLRCLCDCGNEVTVIRSSLVSGNTSSCGCFKRESAIKQLQKINDSGLYKGKNHYNWKGGISPIAESVRACHKMNKWIQDVYTRDLFTCQHCGVAGNGSNLNAHHIITFSDILLEYDIKSLDDANSCEFLWDINNGLTLCTDCHKKVHTKKGPYTKTKIRMQKNPETLGRVS